MNVTNKLFLIDPLDVCPVCFTHLRAPTDEALRSCPHGPHNEDDYPDGAA